MLHNFSIDIVFMMLKIGSTPEYPSPKYPKSQKTQGKNTQD